MIIKHDFAGKGDMERMRIMCEELAQASDAINKILRHPMRYAILSPQLAVYVCDHHTYKSCEDGKRFNDNPDNKWCEKIGDIHEVIEVYVDPRLPSRAYFMNGELWGVDNIGGIDEDWLVDGK